MRGKGLTADGDAHADYVKRRESIPEHNRRYGDRCDLFCNTCDRHRHDAGST
jgi:hypothetical protein